jgi:hypothetical protein
MKIEQRNIKETSARGDGGLLGRRIGDTVTPLNGH